MYLVSWLRPPQLKVPSAHDDNDEERSSSAAGGWSTFASIVFCVFAIIQGDIVTINVKQG